MTARNLCNAKKKKNTDMNIHNQVIETFMFSFGVSECQPCQYNMVLFIFDLNPVHYGSFDIIKMALNCHR